jgi:hypothetical protein
MMFREAPQVAAVPTILKALGERLTSSPHLMKYPGRHPGNLTSEPDAYRAAFFSSPSSAIEFFKKIETLEWGESACQEPRRV